jgi:predicted RNase H-like nuclease (RuvC/YqgF family)
MSGQLVFDLMEDLLATDIITERVDTRTTPNTIGYVVEAAVEHPLSKEREDGGAKVNVAMEDSEEDEDEVLPPGNWKGIILEDYDMLYRLLHSEYRDFDKRHRLNQRTIQGLERKLTGLHSRIQELEAEIDELKALDEEELKKLAKTEEVQALQGNVRDLESKLDFERGQWTELHEKYKALLDWFFVLDHCEGISVAKQVRKRLDDHLDEKFQKRVSVEVTSRVLDIMGNTDMERKLASMDVDDEFNERVLKEALKRY